MGSQSNTLVFCNSNSHYILTSSPQLIYIFNELQESLPPDYARIFAFDNFNRTQKSILAKALAMEEENRDDCATASTYARLYIKEVPATVASKLCIRATTMPIIACGLLQHESKMSVLHFRYQCLHSCVLCILWHVLFLASTIIFCLVSWFLIIFVCSLKKHDSYSDPIKTKDELIFHVGFRQFVAR